MNRTILFLVGLAGFFGCTSQEQPIGPEKIDRGVIALQIDEGHAYIGWRLLKDDPENISFNIYRLQVGDSAFRKVNPDPVIASTNFVDPTVDIGQAYRYRIKKISDNKEIETPGEGTVYMVGIAEFDATGASARLLNKPCLR